MLCVHTALAGKRERLCSLMSVIIPRFSAPFTFVSKVRELICRHCCVYCTAYQNPRRDGFGVLACVMLRAASPISWWCCPPGYMQWGKTISWNSGVAQQLTCAFLEHRLPAQGGIIYRVPRA